MGHHTRRTSPRERDPRSSWRRTRRGLGYDPIAPRERDLQMVLDQDLTGWDEYSELAGVDSLNHEALHLYRLWWELADITVFVAGFRGPHERTDEMVASWEILARRLGK
jgi:hypothetical protein